MKKTEAKEKFKLVEELDRLHKEKGEIVFTFDGGSDSGSYYLNVGGKEVSHDDRIAREVFELMDRELPYGSFAGDFFAEGNMTYDPKRKCFDGGGHEDTTEQIEVKLKKCFIKIPKDLWFDELAVDVSTNESSLIGEDTNARLIIKNGPVVDQHSVCEEEIVAYLANKVEEGIDSYEHSSCTCEDSLRLKREDFKEDGEGNLVYEVKALLGYATISEDLEWTVSLI